MRDEDKLNDMYEEEHEHLKRQIEHQDKIGIIVLSKNTFDGVEILENLHSSLTKMLDKGKITGNKEEKRKFRELLSSIEHTFATANIFKDITGKKPEGELQKMQIELLDVLIDWIIYMTPENYVFASVPHEIDTKGLIRKDIYEGAMKEADKE